MTTPNKFKTVQEFVDHLRRPDAPKQAKGVLRTKSGAMCCLGWATTHVLGYDDTQWPVSTDLSPTDEPFCRVSPDAPVAGGAESMVDPADIFAPEAVNELAVKFVQYNRNMRIPPSDAKDAMHRDAVIRAHAGNALAHLASANDSGQTYAEIADGIEDGSVFR